MGCGHEGHLANLLLAVKIADKSARERRRFMTINPYTECAKVTPTVKTHFCSSLGCWGQGSSISTNQETSLLVSGKAVSVCHYDEMLFGTRIRGFTAGLQTL